MAYYPHITISPFSSIQVMINALKNPRHNGKVWQAKLWGSGKELKKVSEKEPMLYDWIFLVKILKTLESYAKEYNYDSLTSKLRYTITLATDCTGDVYDNTTFIIELRGDTIKVHTNYTYYVEDVGLNVKLQEVSKIAFPLEIMSRNVQQLVEQKIDDFFSINDTNSIFCPPSRLQRIYSNCHSLATSI